MNILFFSRLFHPNIGGVEKHVLKISEVLIKKGHNVTVVSEQDAHFTGSNYRRIAIYKMPVGKNNWFKKFRIWIWLLKNISLIKKADVIHCHDVFFWYLPFRFLFPFKKVFVTFHGYENYPLKSRQILMHKISEKLAFGNICIGDFIQKWYKTKPTYVSYGAVDVIRSKRRKHEKEKQNKNSAVFIGRLDKQTGIKMYVDAYKLIKKKIPDFELLAIGDGPYRGKIAKDIKTLGFQREPEKHFKNYRFAFVSRYLSILEAMAYRKLVFAVFDDPIKKDYLEMSPFAKYIIISGSLADLCSKIKLYLNSRKQERKLVEKAFFWVRKQTWNELTNIYLKLWQKY